MKEKFGKFIDKMSQPTSLTRWDLAFIYISFAMLWFELSKIAQ